jgi:hypothetical protein
LYLLRIFADGKSQAIRAVLCLQSRRRFQRTGRVSSDGLESWVRRRLIKNAIEIVSPASGREGRKRDLWSSGQREPQGGIEVDTVTKLAPLERFVFVMSILERGSNWDCSLFLGCSINQVAQARMKAFRRLRNLAAFPRGEGHQCVV